MKIVHEPITPESLIKYPGFEDLSNEEAEKITRDIHALAQIVFNQMMRKQPPENYSMAA